MMRRHDGFEFPGSPETVVQGLYRNGKSFGPVPARARRWKWFGGNLTPAAFEIVMWEAVV